MREGVDLDSCMRSGVSPNPLATTNFISIVCDQYCGILFQRLCSIHTTKSLDTASLLFVRPFPIGTAIYVAIGRIVTASHMVPLLRRSFPIGNTTGETNVPKEGRRNPLLRSIRGFFNSAQQRVFGRKELEQIVAERRRSWRLPSTPSINELVTKVLLVQTDLKEIRLDFPARTETRYIWKQVSPFEVALSVRKHAYLSHLTAMQLHGLTNESSLNLYVNLEQSPKPEPFDELSQASIDAAFKRSPRTTSQHTRYEGFVIHLLNGKHTRRLGVVNPNYL
jgi:hypothetical protein